ncbi:signal transduction histidine kinase/ligand-binding sensor domain-containing protein/DNA-binding response OmpR family regulator [Dysgonomonas hofstadii]|uniref:histidine kinase n=1 Tax=Dysgonomonas hofstadii TaxID=637886 RepID=A0A840CLA3_9BACT|nr:hybrid sensor histidine kinase/response regulator transcription factor [Dysgonomonas hofstadii]MBB4034194.1 signal transduction histidine kinase/ligand-binding sensor domain-containing protein/DNA-binding response OmpR family regulator [Dysgonomonas hofstadii]
MIFSAFSFYSTAQDITFHHLTTDEGLSQTSVFAMYQDEYGLIWIGTREGLNCYNGNKIKTYKLEKANPNSLFCNNILRITGDKQGKIYVLCTEGLCEYDIKSDKFNTLWEDVEILALHFHEKLYVARGNGIYTYNPLDKKFDLFYELPDKELSITALFIDNQGTFYIGTSHKGLYTLTSSMKLNHPISSESNITSIYQDSDDDIWSGSWEHGLYLISKENVFNFKNIPQNKNSIQSDFVRSCCEDNQGNIWIGTFLGLDCYNKKTKEFKHYLANGKPDGLTHSSIWAIIKDHQGTLWLGTYFGGVNYFNPEYEIYTWYKPSQTEANGLSSAIVGRMIEDKNQNLWICTEGGGLNVYNRKDKVFKWYKPHPGRNSISEDNVKSIYYDPENNLMWLGTHMGGLNKLDMQTDRFSHYRHNMNDKSSIPSDIVRDIVPYNRQLILATSNGVAVFDPQTGKSSPLFSGNTNNLIKNVFALYLDHKNMLWISVAGEGVFAYNMGTKVLKHYKHDISNPGSISNNNINSITQDKHNNLYFCTSGRGLDMYSYETDKFINFDSKNNGLSSDCVYNVQESQSGKLLAITNKGFSVFDTESKMFYNYSIENGFPLSTVNENALYLTNDNEIFLGGVQGMVSFKEQSLNFTKKPYNIILSQLYINSKEIEIGDESGILHQPFSQTSAITLQSSHSIFSVEFATTNYIKANKDEIVYKLEGFSNEWTSVYGQNIITYTNLNPGNYTLVIKSNNPDQPLQEARLDIVIHPPFYRTTIAYLIYIIIIATILFYLINSYKERIKLKASLEYEHKHLEDIEKLNQSKLRFFTNISHEFRTPLTLIIGQLESLLQFQQFTPTIYNKILKVYNNSLQMKELITELLNFRKQELGFMKIYVSQHNLVEFLYENYLLFEGYAKAKNVDIRFESMEQSIEVWYDAKQMQKVVNNLLSNALKHTTSGESITISVSKTEDTAIFKVIDTGCGIGVEDIGHIFDRFYQVESQNLDLVDTGTGIGLALTKNIIDLHHGEIEVESALNEGSAFSVRLKLGNTHFSGEEINDIEPVMNNTYISTPVLLSMEEMSVDILPDQQQKDIKMLIVEDNEELRNMLNDTFIPFYQVITASDGAEGLEKAKTELPNIIVSDVVMPHMTGTELCRIIKNDVNTCHIPIVLLTARTSVESNLEGLKIGADDYISKPFNVNILISRCNNLVNSRIILKEKFSKQPQMTPQMLATNILDKELLNKAVAIVEKNLDNPEFSVNDFALEIGMSRSNLFTKLKAVSGKTPNDFILIIRLKKAAILLKENPRLSVSEISTIVGFNSSRYFSKCFKDIYQLTPLAYRGDTIEEDEL